MFHQLSHKILNTLNKLKGQARIREANIVEALQDIKMSLLEADVHFTVVKHFVEEVKKTGPRQRGFRKYFSRTAICKNPS